MTYLRIPFFLMIFSIFIIGCSEKEKTQPVTESNEQAEPQFEETYPCSADCIWGACSASCGCKTCPDCACFFGWASCDCSGGSMALPTQTSADVQFAENFADYVETNLSTQQNGTMIHDDMDDIQNAIDNNDVAQYESALSDYVTDMNNLPQVDKNTIDQWLINEGEDPFFD